MRRPRIKRKIEALIRGPGEERSSEWYDHAFGRSQEYQAAYNYSRYYFLWAVMVDRVRREGLKRVLEIGCGTGQLAAFLFDYGITEYVGLDFSATAISYARRLAPAGRFIVDDARHSNIYSEVEHDVLICTEVLEHIADDVAVVSRFQPRKRCIFSVPNFGHESHVRFFSDSASVSDRYGPFFDDLDVIAFPQAGDHVNKMLLAEGVRNEYEGRTGS